VQQRCNKYAKRAGLLAAMAQLLSAGDESQESKETGTHELALSY
jgi:hypothetical protein